MYFISAPFGNYIKRSYAISVTGTWTLHPRPGRLKQILKTLRYTKQGWRNKLGLRNPGLRAGMLKTDYNSCLSLAAIQPEDWLSMYGIISRQRNIELNISCPNLGTHEDTTNFEGFNLFTNQQSQWCIVKIPPLATNDLVDKIVDLGYTQIHASNTLPTDKGGLSGKVLVPHTLRLIDYIKQKYPHITVIAGGGVYSKKDAQTYLDEGADHISLGTVCFTPWKLKGIVNET
tara:strand:- start:112 stop:804 length:693 start_codon:yes stop_codon:yes gene_type:complete